MKQIGAESATKRAQATEKQSSEIRPASLRRFLMAADAAFALAARSAAKLNENNACGQWLSDNLYVLQDEHEQAAAHLRAIKRLPCYKNGVPAVYVLVKDYLTTHRQKFREKDFVSYLNDCGRKRDFSYSEIYCLPDMLRIAAVFICAQTTADGAHDEAGQLGRVFEMLRATGDIEVEHLMPLLSAAERELLRDPCYKNVTDESRRYYRRLLERRAADRSVTPAQEAKALLDRAGADGIAMELDGERPRIVRVSYFVLMAALFACAALVPALALRSISLGLLLALPAVELAKRLTDSLFSALVKPRYLPRLKVSGPLSDGLRTCVAVSVLLNARGISEYCENIEQLYLKNRDDNILFGLTADLTPAQNLTEPGDDALIRLLKERIDALNERYGSRFFAIVRPRVACHTQRRYIGWERKRGAIMQLVASIRGKEQELRDTAGAADRLRGCRYAVVLDADTHCTVDEIKELIGIMAHPANRPVIDHKRGRVVSGYGIAAPCIGTWLPERPRTLFERISFPVSGVERYNTSCFDPYYDLFGQGIFTGKGIIDVEAYDALIPGAFPEERILSHDLAEGAILRCATASDLRFYDAAPSGLLSARARQERWVRGDWQLLRIFGLSRFGALDRWKMLDNLRRSLTPLSLLAALFAAPFFSHTGAFILLSAVVLTLFLSPVILAAVQLLSGRALQGSVRYYSDRLAPIPAALSESLAELAFLPYTALDNVAAVIRAVWRMCVSHRRLLDWTTAAQSAAAAQRLDLAGCCTAMRQSTITGALMLLAGLIEYTSLSRVLLGTAALLLGAVWLLSPVLAHSMSKVPPRSRQSLGGEGEQKLYGYMRDMWKYVAEYLNEENNYLLPDNFQEAPPTGLARRTSPTNIGLSLLCILCARDMGFITSARMARLCGAVIGSMERLATVRGHLCNWYDTTTMLPLEPGYVSTVDSGNLSVSLAVLAQGLREYAGEDEDIPGLVERVKALEKRPQFGFLYNKKRRLMYIGCDARTLKTGDACYDLMMSEARLTVYYLVARGVIPVKSWAAQARYPVVGKRHFGFRSWTGTMFEFFMPALFLPVYPGTQQYEALCYAFDAQRARTGENAPFGVSEGCFYAFDEGMSYRYKAMGVQAVGLKRNLDDELTVSPYSSFLTLPMFPSESMKNLIRLQDMGAYGNYGFYEAVDYTTSRTGGAPAFVRCYMAHHIGMSMLSACNYFMDNRFVRRFMKDPQMNAYRELLSEALPDRVFAKRRPAIASASVQGDYVRAGVNECGIERNRPRMTCLSNGKYTCVISDSGAGWSQFNGRCVTLHRRCVSENPKGVYFGLETDDGVIPFTAAPVFGHASDCCAVFNPGLAEFSCVRDGLAVGMKVFVHDSLPAEVRELTLNNTSLRRRKGELVCWCEPSLDHYEDESNHPAYSGLSVNAAAAGERAAVVFTRRPRRRGDATPAVCIGFDRGGASISFDTSKDTAVTGEIENADILGALASRLTGVKENCIFPCFAARLPVEIPARSLIRLTYIAACGESGAQAVECFDKVASQNVRVMMSTACSGSEERNAQAGVSRAELMLSDRLLTETACVPPSASPPRWTNLYGTREVLWEYGVSGDLPIILVTVKNADCMGAAAQYVRAFKYLRSCGISCEAVFMFDDAGAYNRPVFSALHSIIDEAGMPEAASVRGGIHVCGVSDPKRRAVFEAAACCSFICDAVNESERLPHRTNARVYDVAAPENSGREHGFIDGGYEICEKHTMPRRPPWTFVLANERVGCVLSERTLGFTYAFNSGLFRLTPWYNDPFADCCGEKLYMKYKGRIYDLIAGACMRCRPGIVTYSAHTDGIDADITVFVPKNHDAKVIRYVLKNLTERPQRVDIGFGADIVMGRRPHECSEAVRALKENGAVFLFNRLNTDFPDAAAFVTGDSSCNYGLDKTAFLAGAWNRAGCACGGESFAFSCVRHSVAPGNDCEGWFALGCADDLDGARRLVSVLKETDIGQAALECARRCAEEYRPFTIETPDGALNDLVNTFLYYQVFASRLLGRTGFYQSSGAYGFRDQLQDCMSVCTFAPERLKQRIIDCCAHQFEEGDVMHWWHVTAPGKADMGVRTRCSDDMLWLPLAVAEYFEKTRDFALLNEQAAYITAPPLAEGRADAYITAKRSQMSEKVYKHCLRALAKGLNYGRHGLLLFGGGDWNDGFSAVGAGGAGESVWLSMFAVHAIGAFLPLCAAMGDGADYTTLLSHRTRLVDSIENYGWDGKWYLRGWYDDGATLGSSADGECRIDLMPQAFAAVCGKFDLQRVCTALDNAEKLLMDRRHGLLKLFTPAFTDSIRYPGYVSGYAEGVRENGGQYTHGACFFVLAQYEAGHPDKAWELLRLLNPAEKYRCGLDCIYRNEPYVLSGDVYSTPGFEGRGGWSWYTGAAGWYFRLVAEYLAGIRVRGDRVYICPAPPPSWPGFSCNARIGDTFLDIRVSRGNAFAMEVDGHEAPFVPLDGQSHRVNINVCVIDNS